MNIHRFFLGLLSLLFAASMGVFLLYVPMLPVIVVAMILIALVFMFALGYLAQQPLSHRARRWFGNKAQPVHSMAELIAGHAPQV